MLVLVVYAFSISVNTVATGAVTEATNLSVGIVDEDGLGLSRQIAEALVPPTFQRAVQIRATDIDSDMDHGNLLFVVEIPPNFEADIRANRKTVTASQCRCDGGGPGRQWRQLSQDRYLQRGQSFISGREGTKSLPINVVIRAKFNPNLKTAWFSAMTQVINQITLLTVILTGAALIRDASKARWSTSRHARSACGNHARENVGQRPRHRDAAMLSLRFVVRWWLGVPIAGSLCCSSSEPRFTPSWSRLSASCSARSSTTMGQFGLLAMPVLMVTQLLSGSSTPMESMPVWLQYVMQTSARRRISSPSPRRCSSVAPIFRSFGRSWSPCSIGSVYFAVAMSRFRRVIFGS